MKCYTGLKAWMGTLEEFDGMVWIELIWLMIGTRGGLL
jgi:hypothetical protein